MRSDHIAASPICDSSPSTADTGMVANHGIAGRVQAVVILIIRGEKPVVFRVRLELTSGRSWLR